VASHIIDADTVRFGGKYRDALVSTFVKRMIVPKSAVQALVAHKGKVPPTAAALRTAAAGPARPQFQKVLLSAEEFGLGQGTLVVPAPVEQKVLLSVAASLVHRHTGPDTIQQATHRFVKMLFAHDRVDVESGARKMSVSATTPRDKLRKTHVLTKTKEGLKL